MLKLSQPKGSRRSPRPGSARTDSASPALNRSAPLALAACLLSGCVEAREIPEAPEVASLLEAYSAATGVLSMTTIEDELAELEDGESVAREFDDQAYVDDVVATASAVTAPEGELALGRIKFAGQAVLNLERECQSDTGPAGLILARLTFDLAGLDPVIWGELRDCARMTDAGLVRFTGEFIISLDQVEGFVVDPAYWTASFTGRIEDLSNGTWETLGEGTFDAQRRNTELRARVSTGDGDWGFLSYDLTEPTVVQFLDRETLYTCDIDEKTCRTGEPSGG